MEARSIAGARDLIALASMFVTVFSGDQSRAACATQPPPEGLAERCRSKDYVVSDAMNEDQLRTAVNLALTEWMKGCVASDRASGLVYGAEESVDKMVSLMMSLPSSRRSVRIIPDYEPQSYQEDGQTCYGVQSVSFSIAGAQGMVEEPDEDDIVVQPTSTPPSERVKEAAKAAREALNDSSVPGSAELSRFQNVLIELEKYGNDFDDTWFNVQPQGVTACYKESGRCRSNDEALTACTRHLGAQLVQSHDYDKVSQKRYAEILQVIANDIQRSIDHLRYLQSLDSPGAIECRSLDQVFMPRIAEAAGKHSVYGSGNY
jgi:hypothetical protein